MDKTLYFIHRIHKDTNSKTITTIGMKDVVDNGGPFNHVGAAEEHWNETDSFAGNASPQGIISDP
jgi:hypothetical protein